MNTLRENLKRTLRREGFDRIPVDYWLCDSQIEAFEKKIGHRNYEDWFGLSHRKIEMDIQKNFTNGQDHFPRETVPADTEFDEYGIGHSK